MATDNSNQVSFNADNISQVLSLFGQLPPDKKQLLLRMLGLNQERDVFALLDESQTLFAYPEYRLHKILLLYVSPLLLVLGTFGNIFSVFIMRQRSMIRMSAYVYLIHLAVADSMVLYIGLLRLWISELTGMDIRNQTAWLCKLVIFSGYVSSNLSVWLIIAVTVERYIVVCHPLKVNKFCTVPRAKRVVLGLLALFVVIHVHFFWTVTLNQLDLNGVDKHYCGSRKNFHYLVSVAWPWIDAIFYSFLPFVAILVFNTLIIRRIITLSRGAMKMQSAQSNLLQVRIFIGFLCFPFFFFLLIPTPYVTRFQSVSRFPHPRCLKRSTDEMVTNLVETLSTWAELAQSQNKNHQWKTWRISRVESGVSSWCNSQSNWLQNRSKQVRTPVALLHSLSGK